jgi:hypothetical protein
MHGVCQAGCIHRPNGGIESLREHLPTENTRWTPGTQATKKILVELFDLEQFKQFFDITGHGNTPWI